MSTPDNKISRDLFEARNIHMTKHTASAASPLGNVLQSHRSFAAQSHLKLSRTMRCPGAVCRIRAHSLFDFMLFRDEEEVHAAVMAVEMEAEAVTGRGQV